MQQRAVSFIAHTEASTGVELPRLISEEFDAFLECGILAHSYRYLAEAQFRFNRRYDMRAILGSLLRALMAAPRRPERGIRVAEDHR